MEVETVAEDLSLESGEATKVLQELEQTLEHMQRVSRVNDNLAVDQEAKVKAEAEAEAACSAAAQYLHPCHYRMYHAHRALADAASRTIAAALTPAAPAARTARTRAMAHCEAVVACVTSVVCPQYSMEAASWLLRLAELYVAAAFHGEGVGECKSTDSEAGGAESGTADAPTTRCTWLSKAAGAFSAAHEHQCVCLGTRHQATQRTAQWIQRVGISTGNGR